MRTKLFLAFLIVIITALVSNLIFAHLSLRDFEDYSMGMREDRLYWVLASVEGSHSETGWNTDALTHILHWGAILGFDLMIKGVDDNDILGTDNALTKVSATMRRRIESLVLLDSASGEFEEYPLFAGGDEIGTLLIREFKTRGSYDQKEAVFKKRGRRFLLISFLIAGGGAFFLAIALSMFLTGPLRRLRFAAERVSQGDFSRRVQYRSKDEVGRLISSFNMMVESLEREEALRQRLTQNVAHELRTPLAVMRSNIEALADGIVDFGPEALDTLMSEVKRLTNLIKGIEDMTRAEASFFKPSKTESVNLAEFINNALVGLVPLFKEKGISLQVEAGDDNDTELEVDTEKLEAVLINILTNALKYTDKGSVSVRWESIDQDDSGAVIEISDTGRGIPEKQLGVIFKRFHKGDDSDGVGLGLAIAKELSDVMGVRLEVESQEGVGSTFRLHLPL